MEHPLEALYQVRDVPEVAVAVSSGRQRNRSATSRGCCAAVNTSVLYEVRTLADLLREKISGTDRRPVPVAHDELGDVVALFDMSIA